MLLMPLSDEQDGDFDDDCKEHIALSSLST